MHPPRLHGNFSNLMTSFGGTEEEVHQWSFGEMTVVIHEKYRGTPGFYGVRKLLHTWRLQWSSSQDDSVAWRWTWKDGVGYRFSLVGARRSRFTKKFLEQWGKMSGLVLFGLDPNWHRFGDEEEEEEPEGPEGPPAPGEGAQVIPPEVPQEAPPVAPAEPDVPRDAVEDIPVNAPNVPVEAPPMEAPILEANVPNGGLAPMEMELTDDEEIVVLEPIMPRGHVVYAQEKKKHLPPPPRA
jgi:hypothetical protein